MEISVQEVSKEDYIEAYRPGPGMVLVEKDEAPDMSSGRLWYPDSWKARGAKLASTGIIRAVSPFKVFQEPQDEGLHDIFKVGMRVGFNNTTPFVSPMPPAFAFEKPKDKKDINLVTLHMQDIIAVFDFKGAQ